MIRGKELGPFYPSEKNISNISQENTLPIFNISNHMYLARHKADVLHGK